MPVSETNIRPIRITMLVLLTISIGLWNGLRLSKAIEFWTILDKDAARPLYIAISGGFWLLAALFLARGIWQGRTWAWAGTIGSAAGYGSWYWFDRLVLQVSHANWPFALTCTILLIGFLALIIFSPKTRAYFGK